VKNASGSTEKVRVVVFDAGPVTWAVDLSHVREIVRIKGLTILPNAIPEVVGMVNIRGDVVPVINSWWNGDGPDDFDKIMVMEWNGELLGLGIDSVRGIDAVHGVRYGDEVLGSTVKFRVDLTHLKDIPLLDIKPLIENFKNRPAVMEQGLGI